MRFSRVKAKLRRGEAALITCCHFTDPSVYELTSLLGFDGIWLDLEHHSTSDETAANLMRAARVGSSDIIARPAKGEFMRMGRILEAGAQGIMYPRCESADEARELVRWAKFAPQGERGVDGANGDAPYCCMPMAPYLRAANEETLIIAQLESVQAVERAEEIARVPGIDVLMLGPADLSVLAGIPCQFDHPLIAEMTQKVAAAAKASGKWWGTVSGTAEHSRRLLDLGAKFICRGADIVFVKMALEQLQEQYSSLGFTFENRIQQAVEELKRAYPS